MPSREYVRKISESLARGERLDDFVCLFDLLVLLRRPYHQDSRLSEEVVAWLLCVFVPDKPQNYVDAMQSFRLRFMHVSTEPQLQAEFSSCVRNAALTVRNPREIVWTPSVYFRAQPDQNKWF